MSNAKTEAIATADAILKKAGLPIYSDLLAEFVSYDAIVWDDCRLAGDLRAKLQALHHNSICAAARAVRLDAY